MDLKITLNQILEENYFGKLINKAKEASEGLRQEFKEVFASVDKAISKLPEEDLRSLDITCEEGIKHASKVLGLPVQLLTEYFTKSMEITEAIDEILDYDNLEKIWKEFLPQTNITVVDKNSFSDISSKKPYLIFYSAEWCKPCKMRKPMFAKLAPFFYKANLFFTEDEDFAKEQGVDAYPSMVAYFPNGTKVKTTLPLTEKDLWETMNNLIVLGKGFKGEGVLICTETECKIETK